MNKYFVLFYAENEGVLPINDVIEYSKDITNIQDIKNIERIIEKEWFDDGRKIILVNFKKLKVSVQDESSNKDNQCLFCENETINDDKVCNSCKREFVQDSISEQLGGRCFKCGTYYGECACK